MRLPLQFILEASRSLELTRALRVYALLKASGAAHMTKGQVDAWLISQKVSYHDRRKYIKVLLRENWVGFDGQTFYLRGKTHFSRLYPGAMVCIDIAHAQDARAWADYMYALAIQAGVIRTNWTRRRRGKVMPSGNVGELTSEYSLGCVCHLFGVTKAAASRRRSRAAKTGIVRVGHQYQKLPDHLQEIGRSQGLPFLACMFGPNRCRIIMMRGVSYFQMPDVVAVDAPRYRTGIFKRNKTAKAVRLADGRMLVDREK